jgi:CheY-like chemotaxis protein
MKLKGSMRKFLIVDDDAMIRSVLQSLFNRCKLESKIAVNGKQAIEKWEQEDFQAILMDLDMPIMDGICACKEIRQREFDDKRSYTPIIAVSGRCIEEAKGEAMEAGMDGFVAKPFSMKELCDVVFPLAGVFQDDMEGKFQHLPIFT